MYKKIISTILVIGILCSPVLLPSFSADKETKPASETSSKTSSKKSSKTSSEKSKSYDKKISGLEKKESKYEQILKKTKADIQNKEQYSAALVKQIEVLGKEIKESHAEIAKLEEKIAKKQRAINASRNQIRNQFNILKKRIRAIYTAGDTSSLEIILGAKDFGDFVDKLELVKTLSDYDQKLIKKIQAKLDKISTEKKALTKTKNKRMKSERILNTKQGKLSSTLKENEKILDSLYKKESKYQSATYTRGGTGSGSGSAGSIHVTRSGFAWPVPGYYAVVSPFGEDRGYTHKGIDISGAGILGAEVVAAHDGTVTACNNSCIHNWGKSGSCGCGGGYGNYVQIDHANGKQTLYGHLSDAIVKTGDKVTKGQKIGYVGSTGWSTGPHLHYECRYNGSHYNPMQEY